MPADIPRPSTILIAALGALYDADLQNTNAANAIRLLRETLPAA